MFKGNTKKIRRCAVVDMTSLAAETCSEVVKTEGCDGTVEVERCLDCQFIGPCVKDNPHTKALPEDERLLLQKRAACLENSGETLCRCAH